ncbi:MAG: leucine-rich repeat protein [Lachnospiraceae bacterium]|nr:leucine-rich repeat protein [Lachnospiraceae bacterium]
MKKQLLKLTIATLSLGFAIVLTNTKPITAKASNDTLENTGITDDGFSYTIENGEATITSYSLNPNNDLFYGYSVSSNGHTYGISSIRATYDEAERICKENNGHLVTIDSNTERDIIHNIELLYNGPIFIGNCTSPYSDDFSNHYRFEEFYNSPLKDNYSYLLCDTEKDSYGDSTSENRHYGYFYTNADFLTYFICEWDLNAPENYHTINTDIIIPEKINNIPVTKLEPKTFPYLQKYESRDYIHTLTVYAQIESISGLNDCPNLTMVVLPKSLKEINDKTFEFCTNLKTIEIPEKVERIGKFAFNASGIENITIPKSVKTIDNCAFSNTLLNSITFNEGLINIGQEAFSYSGISNIILPDTLETLGNNAFIYSNIHTLIIPKNAKIVTSNANQLLSSLEILRTYRADSYINYVHISHSIPKIHNVIFAYGTIRMDSDSIPFESLSNVVIPESVSIIENNTFNKCKNIQNLYLPKAFESFSNKKLMNILGSTTVENIYYGTDFDLLLNNLELNDEENNSLFIDELRTNIIVPANATAKPTETAEPVETAIPENTQIPETSAEPINTQSPETVPSVVPEATNKPNITASPTEKPTNQSNYNNNTINIFNPITILKKVITKLLKYVFKWQ